MVTSVGLRQCGFGLDFEVAWLFKVMGIGDEIGFVLRQGGSAFK
jgi:hypothetical protein